MILRKKKKKKPRRDDQMDIGRILIYALFVMREMHQTYACSTICSVRGRKHGEEERDDLEKNISIRG